MAGGGEQIFYLSFRYTLYLIFVVVASSLKENHPKIQTQNVNGYTWTQIQTKSASPSPSSSVIPPGSASRRGEMRGRAHAKDKAQS